jgi:hypothetical protein
MPCRALQSNTSLLGTPVLARGVRLFPRSPLLRHAYFVAQSQTPRNCCVRFVAGVTVGSRNTCYRAARYGLTRTGLAPAGLHQLLLAPSESWARRAADTPAKTRPSCGGSTSNSSRSRPARRSRSSRPICRSRCPRMRSRQRSPDCLQKKHGILMARPRPSRIR